MTLTSADSANPLPPRRTLRLAVFLFGLALLPRLTLALVFLDTPIGLDDMHQYDMLARSLASGHGYRWYGRQDVELLRPLLEAQYDLDLPEQVPEFGYRTAYRPPGYPVMLATIYRLVGFPNRLAAARVAQSLLGALVAPLTALIAIRLGLETRGAAFAGAAVALYPYFWVLPAGLASENLFIPLVLVTLLAFLSYSRRKSGWLVIVAAAAMAATTLTRVVMLAFVPIAAWWIYRAAHRRIMLVLVFLGTYLVLVTPWAVHNSTVLERPSFVDGSLGYNLFVGYHPDGDGGFAVEQAVIPLQFLDEAERDRWSLDHALRFIRQDPLQVPVRIARRWVYLWGFEDRELIYFYTNGFFGALPKAALVLGYMILVLPFPFLVASSIPGFLKLRSERPWILSLLLALGSPYLLVLATARFHLPLVPMLSIYAGSAWSHRSPLRQSSKLAIALTIVFAAAVVLAWGIDLSASWPTLQQVLGPGGHKLGLDY